MAVFCLLIGIITIYFMLSPSKNALNSDEGMLYHKINKIGIWIFAIFFVIVGLISIIKNIVHYFND
jgi:hypothetical protein